jgi:hypothetical protein
VKFPGPTRRFPAAELRGRRRQVNSRTALRPATPTDGSPPAGGFGTISRNGLRWPEKSPPGPFESLSIRGLPDSESRLETLGPASYSIGNLRAFSASI